jgi:hypothetical protein
MSTCLEIAKRVEAFLPKPPAVLSDKAQRAEHLVPPFPTNVGGRPAPLSPAYPCVVCGRVERWNDKGIWRCVKCWPPVGVTR